MRIINGRPPRARYLALGGADLSRAARLRLQWMDYHFAHGENAALTCRHFGTSRQSFYRWKRRHDPENLVSLEDHSHWPHRRRQPSWTPQLAERVRRLRQQYPRWGKAKMVALLRREAPCGLHFDGGPHPISSAAARPAGGTLASAAPGAASGEVSPLRRAQIPRLSAPTARRSGAG